MAVFPEPPEVWAEATDAVCPEPPADACTELPVDAVGRTVADGASFTGPVQRALEPQRSVPSEDGGQQ